MRREAVQNGTVRYQYGIVPVRYTIGTVMVRYGTGTITVRYDIHGIGTFVADPHWFQCGFGSSILGQCGSALPYIQVQPGGTEVRY